MLPNLCPVSYLARFVSWVEQKGCTVQSDNPPPPPPASVSLCVAEIPITQQTGVKNFWEPPMAASTHGDYGALPGEVTTILPYYF